MKIAHVTATFPPYAAGTGNVAYHNAKALHERGHDVTVITAAAATDQSFPYEVRRLATPFQIGNAPLTPGLIKQLRGFDIIHLHYGYIFGAELTMLAAQLYRTPYVLTYHNRLQANPSVKALLFRAYNATFESLLLQRAARICAVQIDHLLSVHPQFKQNSKLTELPNGVDTEQFDVSDKEAAKTYLGLPPGAKAVLFVGALDAAHWFKNVEGLLRTFARLSTEDVYLLIAGDGDLRPKLEGLATSLALSPRVRFLGNRSHDDLPIIYSAADLTVLPSLDVESFGLVLIESMACGTPVVASSLPGVRSVVDDGCDGFLVPPGDEAALLGAIERLLGDTETALAMGRYGRQKVIKKFDWQVIGQQAEAIYEDVLA